MIETERLRLREYTLEDFSALKEILSDPVTMAHYPKPYDDAGVVNPPKNTPRFIYLFPLLPPPSSL